MNPSYDYWMKAIAGEKPKMFVDQPEVGLYRKSITERNEKGNSKRIGWDPVAVFMDGETMTARIGSAETGRDVTGDPLNELWSWIAGNAITEEMYNTVARRGEPWPDDHKSRKPTEAPTKDDHATASAFDAEDDRRNAAEDALPPEAKIACNLVEQKAYLPEFATIESDEQSARARSLQTTFLAIKKQAADAYEDANRPLLTAQKALREIWFPLRDDAEAEAKKIASALGRWEDHKRLAAKRAQDEADRIAREHAQALRDAEAANAPPPPPPAAPTPNVPPPATQIRGGTGRAASVKVETFVVAIDDAAVFAQFKGNAELTALLTALAQKAIKAGIPVPGATTEERSVVR